MKYRNWMAIVACLSVMSGCGGGDNDDGPDITIENNVNSDSVENEDTEATSNEEIDSSDTVDTTETSDNSDTVTDSSSTDSNDTEEVVITNLGTDGNFSFRQCGVEVSTVQFSTNIDAPATLTQGQVASGQVTASGSGAESANFWFFDVPPGNYGLVFEAYSFDGDRRGLFIDGVELDTRGIEQNQVFSQRENDDQARDLELVEVGDEGFTLRIDNAASNVTGQYEVALYSEADLIPTPFMSRCPAIATSSVGTTEAFRLTEESTVYFMYELTPGSYEIFTQVSTPDGSNRGLFVDTFMYGISGSFDTENQIESIRENDMLTRSTDTFEIQTSSTYFVRFVAATSSEIDYDIQFSIDRL